MITGEGSRSGASPEQRIRVFLSSPSDVADERKRVRPVLKQLEAEFESVRFELIRWEDSFYTADSSFQSQIPRASECDILVCVLWKRLGTELPEAFNRSDGTPRTGTEFEFEDAVQAAVARDPMVPQVIVYRKTAPILFTHDSVERERAEKRLLDAFWRRWFKDEQGHLTAGFNLFETTDQFAARLERDLRLWLDRRTRVSTWNIATQGPPFRGLKVFEADHADVFFGRRVEIERARARLTLAREGGCSFLLVLGASGAGKSSLVRAGLVPRLSAPGGLPGLDQLAFLLTTLSGLGRDLVGGLAEALLAVPQLRSAFLAGDYGVPATLRGVIERAPEEGARVVANALSRWEAELQTAESRSQPPAAGLVIVLDQLEEIFRSESGPEDAFLNAVAAFARSQKIAVVATMRSDYYSVLLEDPVLRALKAAGRTLELDTPSAASYHDIIRRPAEAAGLKLESGPDRDLAAEIEKEAGEPGALPAVEFLLEALFERRDQRGGLLRLADYDDLGGTAGALAQAGERAIDGLEPRARRAFPRVLRELVSFPAGRVDPAARTVSRSVFNSDAEALACVNALVDARLVISNEGQLGIAHERLLAAGIWPRASRLLDEERRLIEIRDRLMPIASRWQAAPRADRGGLLLTGLPLREGTALARAWSLPESLSSFIAASLRRARRVRASLIGGTAAVMLALAGLSLVATGNARDARRSAERAEWERRLSAQTAYASLLNLAGSAYSSGSGSVAKQTLERAASIVESVDDVGFEWRYLYRSLTSFETLHCLEPRRVYSLAVAGDFSAIAYASVDPWRPSERNAVTVSRSPNLGAEGTLSAHPDGVSALALSHDGSELLTGGLNDGIVRLWRLDSGEMLWQTKLASTGRIRQVAFIPGTDLVAASVEPGDRSDATVDWGVLRGRSLALLDRRTGKGRGELGQDPFLYGFTVSPSGRRVALAIGRNVEVFETSGAGKPTRTFELPDTGTQFPFTRASLSTHAIALRFVSDGILVAAAGSEAHVLNVETGERLRSLRNSSAELRAIVVLPPAARPGDAPVVALASADGRLGLFEVATGDQIGGMSIAVDGVWSAVAVDSSGTLLFGSSDGCLHRALIEELVPFPVSLGYQIETSPDGRTAVFWDDPNLVPWGRWAAATIFDTKLRSSLWSGSDDVSLILAADGTHLVFVGSGELTGVRLEDLLGRGPTPLAYRKRGRLLAVSKDRSTGLLVSGARLAGGEEQVSPLVAEMFDLQTGTTKFKGLAGVGIMAQVFGALSASGQTALLLAPLRSGRQPDRHVVKILRADASGNYQETNVAERPWSLYSNGWQQEYRSSSGSVIFLSEEDVLLLSLTPNLEKLQYDRDLERFTYDREAGAWVHSVLPPDFPPRTVSYVGEAQRGHGAVFGLETGEVIVITSEDGELRRRLLTGHEAAVKAVWVDTVARRAVSGDARGFLNIWHLGVDMELFSTRVSNDPIGYLALGPRGGWLLASTYSLEKGRRVYHLNGELVVAPPIGSGDHSEGALSEVLELATPLAVASARRELVRGDFARGETGLRAALAQGLVSAEEVSIDLQRAGVARAWARSRAKERPR